MNVFNPSGSFLSFWTAVLCGVNTASVDASQGNARAPCCEQSEKLTSFAKHNCFVGHCFFLLGVSRHFTTVFFANSLLNYVRKMPSPCNKWMLVFQQNPWNLDTN